MKFSASFVMCTALILIFLGQPVGSQSVVPVGDEGQVNSYTTGSQRRPVIGFQPDGSFVVVWDSAGSRGNDDSFRSIQGRIFLSDGQPAGPEDQINTSTTDSQFHPAVSVAPDGDFVVVWQSRPTGGIDSSGYSVRGHRYSSNGQRAGSEFLVNTYTAGDQVGAAVATDADGDFVIVWSSNGSSGSDDSRNSIQAKRYYSDGSPAGSQFQVNSFTTSYQRHPAVGMNAGGDFVVVWSSEGSYGSDTLGTSIQGRLFTSAGAPFGPQAQVNTYTTGFQEFPQVGVSGAGDFAVVWRSGGSNGSDTSGHSIQGRIYASNGQPIGIQEQVNTYTTNNQQAPAIGVDAEGNFVVVWESYGSDGSDNHWTSIQARFYHSSGLSAEDQFQVNSFSGALQYDPAVDFDDSGSFIVVWSTLDSSGGDTLSTGIAGQRFAIPLFADDFESGDSLRWSSSIP
jgi:hypothetical protein